MAAEPRLFLIQGQTLDGGSFRPSDWAERLAGVMAPFRPGYRPAGTSHVAAVGYSPYAQPVVVAGIKCVAVDTRLQDLEPMAWDFVCGFARDNGLPMVEACLVDSVIRPVPPAPST
ncbi:MAG: hypothetical protein RLZZ344_197 [Pseudomonadota bacterium]|jgi:hypothetical protein